jgi:AcrR family transcriptional regulator
MPGPAADPRQALVDAMSRSCFERGYTDTTVGHLLEATGLSLAEFHRHFRNKEECAVAAVEEVLTEGIGVVSRAFTGDTSESESTLRALRSLLELFAERPEKGSLALTDSRQRLPRAAFEPYANGFAILIAMLDHVRSDSPLGSLAPPTAAKAALGGPEALIRREIAEGRARELPRLLPDLIYSALVPFLGQREALRIARQGRSLLASDR